MNLSAIVVAASLFLITATVNLQMPLYKSYAQIAGYGNTLTAIVFAAYILGLLPILIIFGGISDRIGRKPVVLASLLAAASATALILAQPTMQVLFISRILQGVSIGLGVGAGTAYLTEILNENSARAAIYVSLTTSLGFGGGALFTSAALLHGKTLTPYSYLVVLLLTLICIVLVIGLPSQNLSRKVVPLIRWPYLPHGAAIVGVAIALAWSVSGLVIAIVPKQLAHHSLDAWSGPALFAVNGTGALVQPLARRMDSTLSVKIGLILLPIGYVLLLGGIWLGVIYLVLIGTAIVGAAGYGFIYLGGLAEVSRLGGEQRARAVSGYFLCAYLGFGLPSILLGIIADIFGVIFALVSFTVVVIAASYKLISQLNHNKSIVV